MDFYLSKGRLLVSGAAYVISNENTNVVATAPSWQRIHAAIRQEIRSILEDRRDWQRKYQLSIGIWSLAERVSERVLPVGKCPLWYRKFLNERCYKALARSTKLFDMKQDPSRGYELELTLKKGVKP